MEPQKEPTYIIRCHSCGTANRVPGHTEGKAGKCGNCGRKLPPLYTKPVELSERTFTKFATEYPGPVIAEFWAPW